MSDVLQLKDKNCIPCVDGTCALSIESKRSNLKLIHPAWDLTDGEKKLQRVIALKGFNVPLQAANEIGKLAHTQWHHPELNLSFNRLVIKIWTHQIDDLVESDFIFAAKVDEILKRYK